MGLLTPLSRMPCPSYVGGEEWHFVVPYLALLRVDSWQRRHPARGVDVSRWAARRGAEWWLHAALAGLHFVAFVFRKLQRRVRALLVRNRL